MEQSKKWGLFNFCSMKDGILKQARLPDGQVQDDKHRQPP